MATKSAKRTENDTSVRTKVVGVRLDPKLRYLAELAARKQRRSISSFIEWAIEESLHRIYLREGSGYKNDSGTTISDDAEVLWDVDEADRFAILAFRYPEMLTHDEQIIWKLVRENGWLWRGRYAQSTSEWEWEIHKKNLQFDRLRESWDTFRAVAEGKADKSALPTWDRKKQEAGPEWGDAEIPF